MFSSYLIDIRDHRSFHHCFDPSTFYSKPRNYQCLYHLQRIKDKNSRLVSLQQTEQEEEGKKKNPTHIWSQFCKSSDAAVPCRPLRFIIQPTLEEEKKVDSCVLLCFPTWCLIACSESVQKSYKTSL